MPPSGSCCQAVNPYLRVKHEWESDAPNTKGSVKLVSVLALLWLPFCFKH